MKEKIFAKLKQAYSPLGLGDVILQAHAESLASLGLVTDDNIDTVIGAQKSFLEGLQKENDKRASEAAKTVKEKARKEFEEETKKKEEEAKEKARLEAEEKAKKEAEEKAKAEAEAKKKAEEEAERKRLEELEKKEVPDYFKTYVEEQSKKAKEEKDAYEKLIAELKSSHKSNNDEMSKVLKDLQEQNKQLLEGYNAMKSENEKAKAEAAKRARQEFILSKANELGIPQYRIDEGFNISDDADNDKVEAYLGKIASNIKANALPKQRPYMLDKEDKPTKEEVDDIVKGMIR